ncbi:Adenosylcobinamide-GDP ribazoletransferase [Roseobacter fucihabitans]|uniref:Adenosylcobinamide-GDP ribazoletransferase n=1 Tax=Roseobacter fucihabitans TaxID=1537242 RepID=A0ABZ2BW36_9RHOB|nr:adenosylcobinamide-GDP ribazoletransferase [Roseobacter litoralis]MBC6965242.1 Cobalamin synthase [Roseobacter litoralis]
MKTDRLPFWLLDILVAGALLSRLPLPHLPENAFIHTARAAWAYPVVGAVLGTLAGACGLAIMGLDLPAPFAAGGVLAALMLLTGAMHEDGLADTADGFWGGFDPARRLEIMKDSQIGTYGVLALLVVTGLRWVAYAALLPLGLLPVVVAAVLSRATMPCLMASVPNARNSGLSKSVGSPSMPIVATGVVIALALAGLCVGVSAIMYLIMGLAVALLVGWLAMRKIKGQTGDVLGATQQLSELAILGTMIAQMT